MQNLIKPDVYAFETGDVTGDKIPDNVFITGYTIPDSTRLENIMLLIQDGATGQFYNIHLRENSGYSPTLFLGDFTGEGTADIMVSIATGGSGGTYYHYIFSFINNMVRLLFDYKVYNEKYKYKVTYLDYYKVEVLSEYNNLKYIIDLSLRDAEYLNEIYDADGKLKQPISGWVDPLSGLYPVDFNYNKIYELLAYQQIAGRYHADTVGYVQNVLKWKSNMFVLDRQEVAIFGMQV
jgi:hypothetical protein